MTLEQDNRGKRDAVRNNSGLPVDHSGPGLAVGPTIPATAGLKPAACPPVSSCQPKSGRGAGGGATSSGSSEAAAAVPSLDYLQNNRNTWGQNLQQLGRKRYCGIWTTVGLSSDHKRV